MIYEEVSNILTGRSTRRDRDVDEVLGTAL